MVRVAFVFRDVLFGWNGGINYYKNLILILSKTNEYIPVIFTSPNCKDKVEKNFPNIEIHYSNLFTENSLKSKLRKVFLYYFHKVVFFDSLLQRYKIDIVSHNDLFPMKYNSKIKSCSWIPDFQSLHLPELYTTKALQRERLVRNELIKNSTKVCVSSEDAKKDFYNYFSNNQMNKILVMPFALPPRDRESYDESVLKRYKLKPFSYFIVSNQFWKHKNHMIIAKALRILHSKGEDILVVATGSKKDLRCSNSISDLDDYITKNNITTSFIFTDNIPYEDVKVLQYYSIAIIQPSLFEGWNTAVEESKLIGKKIILSNIDVHIEQKPENVIYFNPQDAEDLAEKLLESRNHYDRNVEKEFENRAFEKQTERWRDFSQRYIDILKTTLKE